MTGSYASSGMSSPTRNLIDKAAVDDLSNIDAMSGGMQHTDQVERIIGRPRWISP